MSIISFSSDLGQNNFQLAGLESKLMNEFNDHKLVSLFNLHDIYDIESIGYQIYGAIQTFPKNSIHIAICQYSITQYNLLIAKFNDQYLITSNNGIMSLIHSLDFQSEIYSLNYEGPFNFNQYSDQFIQAIQLVISNTYKEKLELTHSFIQAKSFNTQLIVLDDRIVTRVIHIDQLGNIVLNITQTELDQHLGEKPFYLLFHTIQIYQFSPNYFTTFNNNQIGALFNPSGFLELFMIGGNLAKLFSINKLKNNKFNIFIDHDPNRPINFQARI